ncbi:cytochrome P450 [Suillus lakei]|nr:cytochrome P450 [Suillus lakei]
MLTTPELLSFSAFLLPLLISIHVWKQRRLRGGLPLPPGPMGLPILGNVLDLDVSAPWLTYTDWARKYGDIVYSTILGQEFVIITSEEIAHTLLDQRSGMYSDRPYISTTTLFGMDFATGLLSYGDLLRQHRKMYQIGFSKEVCLEYQSMQLSKVHQFLENVIASPTEHQAHLKALSTSIIMAVTYGYDPASAKDPFVVKVNRFIHIFSKALSPEHAALIGMIPFLQYLPSWFPGGRYKRWAGECRGLARDILNDPIDYVKVEMVMLFRWRDDATVPCQRSLDRYATKDDTVTVEDEEVIKAVVGTSFLGGSETTDSTLSVFLLAMILHPEVQIKAQEEIDRVVGDSRLPDFSDREQLPYIEAVYLETLRWRTTVPLNLPHTTNTSDIYNGYYIPKGVNVVVNTWGITHDETRFPDPMSFKPERHLSATGELLEGMTSPHFGFGRRKCPGLYIADQSMWACVASSLATLRIGKKKDATGCEIDVKDDFTAGFTLSVRPKPFECSIEARSANAERLIHASNRGD